MYTFHISLRDIISTVGMIKESIPVFGPSVVYIYTSEMFYSGRLLMAVEAIPVSVSLLKLNVGKILDRNFVVNMKKMTVWELLSY